MIRKSFTKLKRIIFSGLVMSLCTFVFNPTTPANAAMVQESEPNDDWTTADNLSLNTWVKGTMRRKADDRYYRDKDYYKFTISQAGETSIEVNFPPLISANRNQWGPLSCTAGRYCRNKTDPGCGLTQWVTCGFAVHLAFTWVCRQNPKLSSKQRPEPVPIGR